MDPLLLILFTFHVPLATFIILWGWLQRPIATNDWELWSDTGLQKHYCTQLVKQINRIRSHHPERDRYLELHPEYLLLVTGSGTYNAKHTKVCLPYANTKAPIQKWLSAHGGGATYDLRYISELEKELAEHFLIIR